MRRPFKFWFWSLVFSLIVALVGILSVFPQLTRTTWGNHLVTKAIEKKFGGTLTVDRMVLNWSTNQEFFQIHYDNHLKGIDLTVQKVLINNSLWKILFTGFDLQMMEIVSPALKLTNPTKTLTSNSASKQKKSSKESSHFSLLPGKYLLSNGSIKIDRKAISPITFDQINLNIYYPKKRITELQAFGRTMQDQISGTFDIDSRYVKEKNHYSLSGNIIRFPLKGVDELISTVNYELHGLFVAIFGDYLDLHTQGEYSEETFRFSLNLTSPRFSTSLGTEYQNQKIILSHPATLNWKIQPEIFSFLNHTFSLSPKLYLSNPANASIEISQLSLPYMNKKVDLNHLTGTLKSNFSDLELLLSGSTSPVKLSNLNVSAQTRDLSKQLDAQINGILGSGRVQIVSTINRLFTNAGKLNKKGMESQIDIDLEKFPTQFLDIFAASSQYLGNSLNANIKYQGGLEMGFLALSGSTPTLKVSPLTLKVDKSLTLQAPFQFNYTLKPGLVRSEIFSLKTPANFEGDIQSLSFPLTGRDPLVINGNIKGQAVSFSKFGQFGAADLSNFSLEFSSKKETSFKGSGELAFVSPHNPYIDLIGSRLSLGTDGIITALDGGVEFPKLAITVQGEKIQARVLGSITGSDSLFSIEEPVKLKYTLVPRVFDSWMQNQKIGLKLQQPSMISMEIPKLSYPLKSSKREKSSVILNAKAEALHLIDQANLSYQIENAAFHFDLDGPNNEVSTNVSAKIIDTHSHAGIMEGQLQVNNLDLTKEFSLWKGDINGNLQLEKFATAFFDNWWSQENKPSDLMGPLLNLQINVDRTSTGQTGSISVSSSNLDIVGDYEMENKERITLRKPGKLSLKITPEGYRSLLSLWGNQTQKGLAFTLTGPAKLKMNASKLSLPLSKKQPTSPLIALLFPKVDWNVDEMLIHSKIKIYDLSLKQKNDPTITKMDNFELELTKEKLGRPFKFDLSAGVATDAKTGSIVTRGQILRESPTESIFTCNATIKNMPSLILDALSRASGMKFPPSALLGQTLNASLMTSLKNNNGSLSAKIDASNCKADLDSLIVNGKMLLQKPVKAYIVPSDELSKAILKNQSISHVTSRKPFEIYINDKGFSFPISPYSPSDIQIPNMLINLDKVLCENSGSIKALSGLFKIRGSRRVLLWFAPMDIHVRNGIFGIERTEILYNNAYQIAIWGKILMPQEYVNMVLGLTAQSLSALGLSNLSSNYVLQIPIKGPFGNVRVYSEEASSKIGMIIARQAGANISRGFGGPWGNLLGGVLEGITDDQSSVPPAKPPFPWQLETSDSTLSPKKKVTPPKKISSLKRSYKDMRHLVNKSK